MRLAVFFSRGMSLEGWRRAGILDRELALYRAMRPSLEQLMFVTYGDARDIALARDVFPDVDILPNLDGWSPNRYSVCAWWRHRRALQGATALKTNQINGAWAAVLAKWIWRKPLVVRCGYLWTQSALTAESRGWRRSVVTGIERRVFASADHVMVASPAHREVVVSGYGVDAARVDVVSNFVDADVFHPMSDVPVDAGHVIFVGRLSPEKRPMALLEAVDGLRGVSVSVVGDGVLRPELEAFALARGLNVKFMGTVPHAELPRLLCRATALVMPSEYEGNPKALLEAMACGVPVIGTRVRGIRDVLMDGRNGVLCAPEPDSIRSSIQAVLSDVALRARLIEGGLEYIRTSSTLEHVLAREVAILQSVEGGRAA